MDSRRARPVVIGAVTVLVVLGLAAPAIASPAPVSGCPPCSEGFTRGAANHGLETGVQHSEATVHVQRNGSTTWSVRVVPTNDAVLTRLAENRSLARAVAAESFGIRYGGGIDHELISAEVVDGAVVIRYRTLGVVREGPFGTQLLTYFRDSPGAYIYTDLGADELTVVAPHGMTVARGFGNVSRDRMTATKLPGVRDGPFVVFTPEGSATSGVLGILAVVDALWGVVARNLVYFVALPGGVLIGGFAGIRRFLDANTNLNPTRLGSIVAAGGAILFVGTVVSEGDARPVLIGNPFLGGFGGPVLFALGVGVAASGVRRHLTGPRLLGAGIAVGIVAMLVTDSLIGTSAFLQSIPLATALLPTAVALGWLDADVSEGDRSLANRLFVGLSVVIVGVLVVAAPLRALGGSLFLLAPILLTFGAVGVVVVVTPLYLLGVAGATAERT